MGRRIAIVDLAEEQLSWIDIQPVSIWEAAGFADGRIIAVLSDDHTESGWYGARLSIIDEGREIPLHTSNWQIAGPVVSPSGRRVAFVEGWASDRGHLAGDLAIADVESHEITLHTGDTLGLDVVSAQWLDDDHLWVTGWRGFSAAWATIDASNFLRIEGGVVPRALSISRSSTMDSRTALVTASDDGRQAVEVLDQDRLTDRIHDSVPESSLEARQSVVHWLARDGVRIEGILVHGRATPPERQRLIIMVHGGPANLWTDTLSPGARALVLGGYSVLLPNPRGSVGRGQAFATANLGDPGGAELGDLLAGAEACRIKGLVMDASPGIVGGSYGGYLAACAAVFSTEVAAAVAMFGHPDLLSARLASNNGAFYDRLLGIVDDSPGWQLAFERSPAFHVRESAAPTLLLHGDRDACTPLGQSEELFGALLAAGVESQLVVYPGAGHGLRGERTQKDVWERTIDWFDRHLEEAAAC
jgi:dipeptidyl aminopeptidase/acylaminoacyl peptidase